MTALTELITNASLPFEQARAMPPSVYTSPSFLELEREKIFAKEWICLGRSSALKNPGDYTTSEIAGQPILVMRGEDGKLRAMANVCLHRMSTLLEGSGNRRSIVCPYHAWTYKSDGSLRSAPAMKHNECFKVEGQRLPEFRCEEWLGWTMVTLNPNARPVAEALKDVEDHVGDYGMEDYVQSFCETFTWNTNWKILAENFMESYHLPVCHAATIGEYSKLDEMVCPPGLPSFNYHTILKDDRMTLGLAHPSNTRLKGERRRMTYLLSIYPTLLITLTPGYFWYLSLQPKSVGEVNVIFGGGMSPDFANSPEAQEHFAELKRLLDEVNVEDKGCTEKVFRGASSPRAKAGLLSHLERPNYDFAQWIAARVGRAKPSPTSHSRVMTSHTPQ